MVPLRIRLLLPLEDNPFFSFILFHLSILNIITDTLYVYVYVCAMRTHKSYRRYWKLFSNQSETIELLVNMRRCLCKYLISRKCFKYRNGGAFIDNSWISLRKVHGFPNTNQSFIWGQRQSFLDILYGNLNFQLGTYQFWVAYYEYEAMKFANYPKTFRPNLYVLCDLKGNS